MNMKWRFISKLLKAICFPGDHQNLNDSSNLGSIIVRATPHTHCCSFAVAIAVAVFVAVDALALTRSAASIADQAETNGISGHSCPDHVMSLGIGHGSLSLGSLLVFVGFPSASAL